MDFIELSPSLVTLMGGIISLYAYKPNDVKATDEGRPFKASHFLHGLLNPIISLGSPDILSTKSTN